MDGNGNFTMTTYLTTTGTVQSIDSAGTYTIGQDCRINLTFTSGTQGTSNGATGSVLPPSSFAGLLANFGNTAAGTDQTAGLITVIPTNGQALTGIVIPQ
jgi:hypothetical protein